MTLPVTDPVLIVAIAMAAFLLMPLITNRLHLPDIIGILLAGVLVGPHGLGLLERDATIHLLGTVGLLYLVFLAGLEVDLGDLSRQRKRAISFGVSTFLVPQVIGTIGGLLLFDFDIWTAVLLGSVFSSHSFLALLIAKRLGLTERESVITTIGGTVITDTLALLVLAVVAQTTTGDFGPVFLLRLLLQAGIFAAAVVFGLPLLGRWFFRRVTDGGAQFAFMMTALFACGYVAHLAGLEPIIGAFLAGLAMNRLVPHHGVLASRAFFIGNTIFVPFFLLSVGMLIDLGMVIGDLRTIEMAVFMTVTVVICKGGAAWLMRLFFGYSRDDVVVSWGLSMPQAATTLAVVLVGHDLELFDDAILNATIVMVLVTCVLGPVLVQIAGRRLASAAPHHEPTPREANLQRILLPLASPKTSATLLDIAIALRRPLVDEPVLPLSVAPDRQAVATSERLLASSVLHLAAADVPVSPVIRVDLNPVNGILRAMAEQRATTLVLGWRGPESGWQRHFHLARGLIDEVIAGTTTQVLIVRAQGPLSVIERVVLAIPGNAASEFGFAELIGDCKLLTKRIGANLLVVGDGVGKASQREEIDRIGPSVPTQVAPELASAGTTTKLMEALRPDDLVIIVGCREGTVSWDANWNRLPTRLAHRVPEVSLAVAYPRMESLPFTLGPRTAPGDGDLLAQAVFELHVEADDLQDMVAAAMPSFNLAPAPSAKIAKQLVDNVQAFGDLVALSHVHTAHIDRPRLSVIVGARRLDLDGHPVRMLLVLLNPSGVPSERHLENLAAIARVVRDPTRIAALLVASDEGDIHRARQSFRSTPGEHTGSGPEKLRAGHSSY